MRYRSLLYRITSLMLLASNAPTVLAVAPDFGPNVIVFDASTPDVQAKIDAVYGKQEAAQFGNERFALAKPVPGKFRR